MNMSQKSKSEINLGTTYKSNKPKGILNQMIQVSQEDSPRRIIKIPKQMEFFANSAISTKQKRSKSSILRKNIANLEEIQDKAKAYSRQQSHNNSLHIFPDNSLPSTQPISPRFGLECNSQKLIMKNSLPLYLTEANSPQVDNSTTNYLSIKRFSSSNIFLEAAEQLTFRNTEDDQATTDSEKRKDQIQIINNFSKDGNIYSAEYLSRKGPNKLQKDNNKDAKSLTKLEISNDFKKKFQKLKSFIVESSNSISSEENTFAARQLEFQEMTFRNILNQENGEQKQQNQQQQNNGEQQNSVLMFESQMSEQDQNEIVYNPQMNFQLNRNIRTEQQIGNQQIINQLEQWQFPYNSQQQVQQINQIKYNEHQIYQYQGLKADLTYSQGIKLTNSIPSSDKKLSIQQSYQMLDTENPEEIKIKLDFKKSNSKNVCIDLFDVKGINEPNKNIPYVSSDVKSKSPIKDQIPVREFSLTPQKFEIDFGNKENSKKQNIQTDKNSQDKLDLQNHLKSSQFRFNNYISQEIIKQQQQQQHSSLSQKLKQQNSQIQKKQNGSQNIINPYKYQNLKEYFAQIEYQISNMIKTIQLYNHNISLPKSLVQNIKNKDFQSFSSQVQLVEDVNQIKTVIQVNQLFIQIASNSLVTVKSVVQLINIHKQYFPTYGDKVNKHRKSLADLFKIFQGKIKLPSQIHLRILELQYILDELNQKFIEYETELKLNKENQQKQCYQQQKNKNAYINGNTQDTQIKQIDLSSVSQKQNSSTPSKIQHNYKLVMSKGNSQREEETSKQVINNRDTQNNVSKQNEGSQGFVKSSTPKAESVLRASINLKKEDKKQSEFNYAHRRVQTECSPDNKSDNNNSYYGGDISPLKVYKNFQDYQKNLSNNNDGFQSHSNNFQAHKTNDALPSSFSQYQSQQNIKNFYQKQTIQQQIPQQKYSIKNGCGGGGSISYNNSLKQSAVIQQQQQYIPMQKRNSESNLSSILLDLQQKKMSLQNLASPGINNIKSESHKTIQTNISFEPTNNNNLNQYYQKNSQKIIDVQLPIDIQRTFAQTPKENKLQQQYTLQYNSMKKSLNYVLDNKQTNSLTQQQIKPTNFYVKTEESPQHKNFKKY